MNGPSCVAEARATSAPMKSRPRTIGIRNQARRWIRKWNSSPIVRTKPKALLPRQTWSGAGQVYKSILSGARFRPAPDALVLRTEDGQRQSIGVQVGVGDALDVGGGDSLDPAEVGRHRLV